jgi:hypothetical protein
MTCSVAKAAPATGYLLRNVPPHVAYRSVRIGHLLRRTRAGRIPRALRQATRNAPRSHRRYAPRGGREDVASIDKASLVDYGNRCAPAGSTRQVVGRARGTPVRHGEYRESRDDRLSESPACPSPRLRPSPSDCSVRADREKISAQWSLSCSTCFDSSQCSAAATVKSPLRTLRCATSSPSTRGW